MIEPWMIWLAVAGVFVLIAGGLAAYLDWREAPDDTLQLVTAEMDRRDA